MKKSDQSEYPTGGRLVLIVVTVLLGVFCASMEAMVTATLMPSILASMEGFALYPWVAASYLLASVATTPLCGQLADLYGYRRLYRLAVVAFLLGSALCGLSTNMGQLIFSRTIQGMGSAGLITLSVVLFGAVFPIHKRAKMQAMIAATWAVSSIVGPSVGAFCVQYLSWRWAFFINVPAAIVIFLAVSYFGSLHSALGPAHPLDFPGTALFIVTVLSAVAVLLSLGQWYFDLKTLFLLTVATVSLVGFIRYLKKAEKPVLPIQFFHLRFSHLSLAMVAISGGLLFSLVNFLPLYVQGVLGLPAYIAGLVVTVIAIGTFAGSLFSGLCLNYAGFRIICALGASLSIASLTLLVFLLGTSQVWPLVVCNIATGMGLAMVGNATIVATQALAPKQQLGAASSLFHFFRMLGGTLGIALLGGIQLGIFHYATDLYQNGAIEAVLATPQKMFDLEAREHLSQEALAILSKSMRVSLQWVFGIAAVFAVLMGAFALRMPRLSPAQLQESIRDL